MRYTDVYPSDPLVRSDDVVRPRAADLLRLEFFKAEPADMPRAAFSEHHLLLNLNPMPHRVENWRGEDHRDFMFKRNEIILTPAGTDSGWRWHAKSEVIVITLDPDRLKVFAELELAIILAEQQLESVPQTLDMELCAAGKLMLDALEQRAVGFEVVYESLCRLFLVQLLQKYGIEKQSGVDFSKGFTPAQYERVLRHIDENYGSPIPIESLAEVAGWSPAHFSRLFKSTIGETPHRFLMQYRVERARRQLDETEDPLIAVATACGFADQAHLTRYFKQIVGCTPRQYRKRH